MTEEIKEILNYWQFYINESNNYKLLNVHFDEIKKVLDYITNLQKENENLLYEINGYLKEKEQYKEKINKLEDYKSRNEEAVEYLKSLMDSEVFSLERDNEAFKGIDKKQVAKNEVVLSMLKTQTLLNILQGGDE